MEQTVKTKEKSRYKRLCSNLVRTERLELSHLAALEPKSSVSTNSTTSAFQTFEAKTPDY
jgi:hypothetical protein